MLEMKTPDSAGYLFPATVFNLFLLIVSLGLNSLAFAFETTSLENTAPKTWSFSVLSRNNVLHQIPNETERQRLEKRFSGIRITTTASTLEVSGICSIKSVRHEKKPLDYWMSKSTTELYAALFAEENIPLQDPIHEVTNLWPQDECEVPFDSLIENGDALVTVVGSGYLLIFRPVDFQP